jgi:hypothetical protein
MWMSNKNGGERPAKSEPLAETQPTLRHAFRHVYRFILQAVKGDKAIAHAIFEDFERSYHRLVEIEKWAADQQQYNRPFAHFGLLNGHAGRTWFAI